MLVNIVHLFQTETEYLPMQEILLFNKHNYYFADTGLPVNLPVIISYAVCVNKKLSLTNK